jgi:hypothetical protein
MVMHRKQLTATTNTNALFGQLQLVDLALPFDIEGVCWLAL